MDQIKIGKFIAERRKAIPLTQMELGARLGVTNKAVSKWERGICLPDVSLYQDLCMVLGISLNELFAGEFIEKEDLEMRSEDNLMDISAAEKRGKRRLRRIVAALACALAAAAAVTTAVVLAGLSWRSESGRMAEAEKQPGETVAAAEPPYHYIETRELTEEEWNLYDLLVEDEPQDISVFHYNTGSSMAGGFTVDATVYRDGDVLAEETVYRMDFWERVRHEGEIVIALDWNRLADYTVKATVNSYPGSNGTGSGGIAEYLDDDGWFAKDVDEGNGAGGEGNEAEVDVSGRRLADSVGISRSQLYTGEIEGNERGKLRIADGSPIGLICYGFTENGDNGGVPEPMELADGTGEIREGVDVCLLFTVTFTK